MKNTRVGIFETNSSSSHSLSLGRYSYQKPDETNEETIVLGEGEYGWGYEELTTWMERADYLGVEARDNEDKKDRLIKAIHKFYPNVTIEFGDGGYIDHQSSGEVWDECRDEYSLLSCIFGDTIITIDNDNH